MLLCRHFTVSIDHNLQIALKIVRVSGNAAIIFECTWCTVITGHKTKVIVTATANSPGGSRKTKSPDL